MHPATRGALLLVPVLVAACAASFEEVEHVPATEMRPGPGLFSGEAGEFVIYRR